MDNRATPRLMPPGATLVHSPADVQAALDRMAREIQPVLHADDCVLLTVLLGGLLPAARLASLLEGDFVMDYCHVTRYQGRMKGGAPEWRQAPGTPLAGRTVVIVDDIFDEGVTLAYVRQACRELGARRVVAAVLAAKRRRTGRSVSVAPEIVGLEVPDRFVFGCGMDLAGHWRHLPGIYALDTDEEDC